jgi:hypothetical protein
MHQWRLVFKRTQVSDNYNTFGMSPNRMSSLLTYWIHLPLHAGFRDDLKLCEGFGPSCDDDIDETLFCTMNQGDLMGHFNIGIDFFGLWSYSFVVEVGNNAYKNCGSWNDGTVCGLGSTCNMCKNPACELLILFNTYKFFVKSSITDRHCCFY